MLSAGSLEELVSLGCLAGCLASAALASAVVQLHISDPSCEGLAGRCYV